MQHEELGLTLHPFDLATSKVLALVGRVEPRDFVDTLACDERVQPLGYLAWAAWEGPGLQPASIIEEAARTGRYSEVELCGLDFEGAAPDARALAQRWHAALAAARGALPLLPAARAGCAVLATSGGPYRGDSAALREALPAGAILFHPGSIRGAVPRIV